MSFSFIIDTYPLMQLRQSVILPQNATELHIKESKRISSDAKVA